MNVYLVGLQATCDSSPHSAHTGSLFGLPIMASDGLAAVRGMWTQHRRAASPAVWRPHRGLETRCPRAHAPPAIEVTRARFSLVTIDPERARRRSSATEISVLARHMPLPSISRNCSARVSPGTIAIGPMPHRRVARTHRFSSMRHRIRTVKKSSRRVQRRHQMFRRSFWGRCWRAQGESNPCFRRERATS